jgi:hypothetical protein
MKVAKFILSSLTFFETIQLQNVIRGFNDVKNLQNRMQVVDIPQSFNCKIIQKVSKKDESG